MVLSWQEVWREHTSVEPLLPDSSLHDGSPTAKRGTEEDVVRNSQEIREHVVHLENKRMRHSYQKLTHRTCYRQTCKLHEYNSSFSLHAFYSYFCPLQLAGMCIKPTSHFCMYMSVLLQVQAEHEAKVKMGTRSQKHGSYTSLVVIPWGVFW